MRERGEDAEREAFHVSSLAYSPVLFPQLKSPLLSLARNPTVTEYQSLDVQISLSSGRMFPLINAASP